MNLVATIPAPPGDALRLGPLTIHAYGILIAVGVLAAISLAGRRLEAAGAGTREAMGSIGIWGVVAGVIGARLYYVATDPADVWKRPSQWFKVWEGGLGIPGGLLAGIVVAAWVARRASVSPAAILTAAAPAIPLAQAIGRWGNWFNQELYGRATTLPWALEVDADHLPRVNGLPSVPVGTTFHPTFLYESLWNLALCGALILIDRRARLRPGRLMAVYVAGYAFGRFLVEGLRIDPASSGGGLRLNQWIALVAFAASIVYLVVDASRPRPALEHDESQHGEPPADEPQHGEPHDEQERDHD